MLNKLQVHMLMEENNIYRKILKIPAKLPTGTFEPVGKVLTLLYSRGHFDWLKPHRVLLDMVRTDTALAAPEATHTATVTALESIFTTSPVSEPTAMSAVPEL